MILPCIGRKHTLQKYNFFTLRCVKYLFYNALFNADYWMMLAIGCCIELQVSYYIHMLSIYGSKQRELTMKRTIP